MGTQKQQQNPKLPAPAHRQRRNVHAKIGAGSKARGLAAADVAIAIDSAEIADVVALVRGAGGAPIGAYRDPLADGRWCWPRCR